MHSLLIFFILDICGSLPLRARRWIGRAAGAVISLVPSREKEIASLHLSLIKLPGRPEKTIREMFTNLAQSIMESLNLTPLLKEGMISLAPGNGAELDTVLSSGRGILALTAHTGNWDLLGAFFAARGQKIHTVGREARSSLLQPLLAEMRRRSKLETIWREGSQGIKNIITILKNGGIMAALIDQDTQVTSTFVPFFGVPAKTPSSLIEIARRTGCIVYVALMNRTASGTFEITLTKVPDNISTDEILLFYNATLEAHLKKYPAQWVWFHKRWRSTADGVTLGTKDYLDALRSGKIALHT